MACIEGLKLLQERRSIRSFEDRQISDADLEEILKTARFSPTAHNRQLFHFTVVQNKDLIEEMAEAIRQVMLTGTPEQQEKASKPGYSPLYHAPTVIMITGDLKSGFNVQTDCGIAAGMIIASAEELGLASCMIGSSVFMFRGDKGDDLREKLQLPEGYNAIGVVAIGYRKGSRPEPAPRKDGLVTYIR